MRSLNLTKQLFWIIASFIIAAISLITYYLYYQSQEIIEERAYSRARSLQTYFVSMRYVYHHQFLSSGLDLNDSTVGFLPAHAAALISDEFTKRTNEGISIRNVTDRPRNPINRADVYEVKAMRHFAANPTLQENITLIQQNNQDYYFYSSPLRIEPYCIQCHGKKEEVLPFIASRYDTAYDYKVGDIRGVTSIKIPRKIIADETQEIFWKETLLSWSIILFLLGLIYYAIRQLTRRDVDMRRRLQAEVYHRTADLEATTHALEVSNLSQQHLFSILRTIADSNKVLITSQSLEELIDKTAQCLAKNEAFSCVKISLIERGELQVKAAYGIDSEWNVLPIEKMALERNMPIVLTDFSTDISPECREKVERYHITAVYVAALQQDSFTPEAFGIMMICTTQPNGFTGEETVMIDELAGDLGFAINSFYQKDDIFRLSFYDPLTELPNRRLLMERFTKAMISSSRTLQYGGVLFIDLDNFKGINDFKGHISGDEVLRQMGKRLIDILRQTDTVARFGGDEYVILIENIATQRKDAATAIQEIAYKILEAAKNPFLIDEQPCYLSASIGIVLFSGEEFSVDQLLSHADSAMYAAKNSGRNTAQFYDAFLQETMAEQARLIHDLRSAIPLNQLYVVYQEQVNIQGITEGVEALMRWEHPEKGLISPAYFIPLAENSGSIISLGDWIFTKVIEQLQEWKKDSVKQHWRISVNVSPKQFEEEAYIAKLQEHIARTQIDPAKIRLELTEGLLIQNTQNAMEKINILKAIGFSFSIDDFGTGYSSLSYLKHLPIDELKIDQSFVKVLPESISDQIIIQTIITIGKTFGLEVIAEGVETTEQFELLRDMGCNTFQGFLFSRPQRAEYYATKVDFI